MISDAIGAAYHFLQSLYGDEAPGWLTIWTLPDKATKWFPAQKLEDAATYAISLAETHEVYFGVGLREHKLTNGRGTVTDVLGIPALWMDFDIQHPVHKARQLPPSIDDIVSLLKEIPLSPSILVNSGYGVHAYWLLREFWRFEDAAERQRAAHLIHRLQATFKAKAQGHGWNIDSTFSLDHVLRVPGTLNHKLPDDPKHPYVMEGRS